MVIDLSDILVHDGGVTTHLFFFPLSFFGGTWGRVGYAVLRAV